MYSIIFEQWFKSDAGISLLVLTLLMLSFIAGLNYRSLNEIVTKFPKIQEKTMYNTEFRKAKENEISEIKIKTNENKEQLDTLIENVNRLMEANDYERCQELSPDQFRYQKLECDRFKN